MSAGGGSGSAIHHRSPGAGSGPRSLRKGMLIPALLHWERRVSSSSTSMRRVSPKAGDVAGSLKMIGRDTRRATDASRGRYRTRSIVPVRPQQAAWLRRIGVQAVPGSSSCFPPARPSCSLHGSSSCIARRLRSDRTGSRVSPGTAPPRCSRACEDGHLHRSFVSIPPEYFSQSASRCLRIMRPRCILDLTVPMGTPSTDDISE